MIKDDIILTVCCMTYNHGPYIRQCLEGFVMQRTGFRFKVIVHDDASTDDTAEVVREFEAKYPDIIKPIYQTANQYSQGIDPLSKYALPLAEGRYIALCEGDDYWIDPLKLQKQVDFMDANPDYGLCCTDFSIYYQSTGKMDEALFRNDPKHFPIYTNPEDFLYSQGYMAPCTWVIKPEFLLDDQLGKHIDGSFAIFVNVLATSKVHVIMDNTAVYRILSESASHTTSLEKTYTRASGLFKTQMDSIERHHFAESLRDKIAERYYKRNFKLFVALGKKQDIADAMAFWSGRKISLRTRKRLLLSKTKWGRKLMYREIARDIKR